MDNILDQKIVSKINFNDPVCTEYLSEIIYERVKMPFVVLCLGTDKDIADSLGPLTGHFLSMNRKFPYPVFGTLSKPVHNENLHFNLDMIRHQYPKHGMLIIDAAIGEKDDFGKILLMDKWICTSKNHSFFKIGDLSIWGISDYEGSRANWLNSVRLNTVYEMAQIIAKAVGNIANRIVL